MKMNRREEKVEKITSKHIKFDKKQFSKLQ